MLAPSTILSQRLDLFKETRTAILTHPNDSAYPAVVIAPARDITADQVNNLLHITGTEIQVALSQAQTESLMLTPMQTNPLDQYTSSLQTRYKCVSVEARVGVSTGISSCDRAKTISLLGQSPPDPKSLVRPGHVFPICVSNGGALVRSDLPEGALDLLQLRFDEEAAAFLYILNKNGTHCTKKELQELSTKFSIPTFELSEIIEQRLKTEKIIKKVAETKLPTVHGGPFKAVVFQSLIDSSEHIALIKGKIDKNTPTLTRVQAESTFQDVFGGKSPTSKDKIQFALEALSRSENGVFLYLRRPELGQIEKELKHLKENIQRGSATMMQEYGLGAQILRDLGVGNINLLSTSHHYIKGLESFGLDITSEQPLLKQS